MVDKPIITVIIPAYNNKEVLAESIDSVLKQTQKNIEVIVLDDCSTDGTDEFMKTVTDERVRYIRFEQNRGVELNVCVGLKEAKGKYLVIIAQDDYYTDYEFFNKALKVFEEHDSETEPLSFVSANAIFYNCMKGTKKPSNIGGPGRVKGIDHITKKEYGKALSTFPTLFKTEVLRKAGLEDMMIFDTTTYYLAALLGDAWYIPDVIGVYRYHEDSISLGYKKKKHPALDARHYITVDEGVKRRIFIMNELSKRIGRKEAYKWYVARMRGLCWFYSTSRPEFKDRMKVVYIMIKNSGFMPRLWLILFRYEVRSALRKITPLHKLYRFVKYTILRKPNPDDN